LCDDPSPAQQPRSGVEPDDHIPAIDDPRDDLLSRHTQRAEIDLSHEPSGHSHENSDSDAQANGNAVGRGTARREQDDSRVISRRCR
jgi:hypothetical protein